uniref:Uncharacterized protein n=1 Tax=Cacopsylla melanoneura TaxID=428564 RepID=A0A8D8TH30_9HEMI
MPRQSVCIPDLDIFCSLAVSHILYVCCGHDTVSKAKKRRGFYIFPAYRAKHNTQQILMAKYQKIYLEERGEKKKTNRIYIERVTSNRPLLRTYYSQSNL